MLNDTKCRNAKPKAAPYKLTDEKGLYLEVKPNGKKAWRYRFKLAGATGIKESTFAIGSYGGSPTGETNEQAELRKNAGIYTLAEARLERMKARALVKQGINPAHQRKQDRIKREQENAITFESVAREWVGLRDWEDITKKRRLDMLQRVVFPHIGVLPTKHITSAQILDVLRKANTQNGPSVKDEAKRTMSGIFDFAVSTLRADTNPVFPVRKALPPNKTQHKRPLSETEIGELLRSVQGYERNFQTVAAFRLMWLTLCRPNEVMGACWAEIDLDKAVWSIPAERMKKRREHVVPLPHQAVELLRSIQGVTGHRKHVFPHRDKREEHMTENALRQALMQLGWNKRFSPHATRTTGSTRLNEMGFPADWIERQLAHVGNNAVRRAYNHADYLQDRTRMMQQWADMLDVWTAGENVVVADFRNLKKKSA